MKIIDYRSDTVTKPSPEMWKAIKEMDNSMLGDDVEKDDPTVNKLEEKAAKLVGKEKALFVTSGTQGNLISLLCQSNPGDEILVEEFSHIYKWEVGGAARIGGLMVKTFPSDKGMFKPKKLQPFIRDLNDIHQPTTSIICLENTHNYHGGIALPPSLFQKTREFAVKNNLKFHVDGARIFNSAIVQNKNVKEFTKYADSIQFCLSKGLACPIGSIIAGTSDFINKAIKFRKMLGGGWRQAGIIASMGIVAIEDKWINKLSEDHKNAKLLAKELSNFNSNLQIKIPTPDTNLVMVELPENSNMEKIISKLNNAGIASHNMGQKIRFVTHYGITQDDIEHSVPIIEKILKKNI